MGKDVYFDIWSVSNVRWLPPYVIIAAKLAEDNGTARDKIARIKELETQRNQHVASGRARYEVVACIDGGDSASGVKICGRCSSALMGRFSPQRHSTNW